MVRGPDDSSLVGSRLPTHRTLTDCDAGGWSGYDRDVGEAYLKPVSMLKDAVLQPVGMRKVDVLQLVGMRPLVFGCFVRGRHGNGGAVSSHQHGRVLQIMWGGH